MKGSMWWLCCLVGTGFVLWDHLMKVGVVWLPVIFSYCFVSRESLLPNCSLRFGGCLVGVSDSLTYRGFREVVCKGVRFALATVAGNKGLAQMCCSGQMSGMHRKVLYSLFRRRVFSAARYIRNKARRVSFVCDPYLVLAPNTVKI